MRLKPVISSAEDSDGVVRWSVVVENADTNIPICHIISADSLDAAESNVQQIFQLLKSILLISQAGQTLDLSLWPEAYRLGYPSA
jgi:hypothetical protein